MWRQTALRVPGCLPPIQPAPHAGRYHQPGDPWPLYACLDPETMWAEWRRATGGGVAPEDDPRWVCTLDVDLAVLDLRDPGTRLGLGLDDAALVGDWAPGNPNPATTRVAEVAREMGVEGIVVPSAARPDGWNLVVLPRGFERVHLISRRRQVPQTEDVP